MNRFLTDGTLTEAPAGDDFVYILNDPSCVAADEYNYLAEGDDGSFAKLMYGNFSGQNAFYYVVNSYKSLSVLAQGIEALRYTEIVRDFLRIVIKVKEDDVLKEENILTSPSKIFIDPVSKDVKAVYAPVVQRVPVKAALFEGEVRDVFARLMKRLPNLKDESTDEVVACLMDEKADIKETCDMLTKIISRSKISIADIRDTGELTEEQARPESAGHTGYLTGRNMPAITLTHLGGKLPEIVITDDNFVLGRSSDSVDGAVPDASVSRIHCKISQVGNKIAVIDLGSANGTFVNGSRLRSGEARYITDNDTLRIGKCDFLIKFPKDVLLEEAAVKAQLREAVESVNSAGVQARKISADQLQRRAEAVPGDEVSQDREQIQSIDHNTASDTKQSISLNSEGSKQARDMMISAESAARLVMFYSASGGTGKTTVAVTVSRLLAASGKRVLYLCTSAYQTFGKLLGYTETVDDDSIAELKEFHQVRQFIKREGFEFLPEIRRTSISAGTGITDSRYIDIISKALVSDRYDIVVIDADSAIDDLNKWLIEKCDQLFVITKQDDRSYMGTKMFADLVSVIAANKITYICNDYQEYEHDAIADEGAFGGLDVAVRVEHFKNYDKLTVDDLVKAESLKAVADRVVC